MPHFDPSKPYNDLPLLPPAQDIESKAILKKCIEATRQLEGLRQAAMHIPNQTVLINSIPLREARDSSAIENIVTTNDKLWCDSEGRVWRREAGSRYTGLLTCFPMRSKSG